jgi:hypothetical protein
MNPLFCGVLGMTDDELSTFIRDNNIEFYRGPNPEAEREAEIFEAITRAKPGRKKKSAKPIKPHKIRGRPSSRDKETLAALRRDYPGDCKAEFYALLESHQVPKRLWARKYRAADQACGQPGDQKS